VAETTKHQCQTSKCPNEYEVILLWAEQSTAQYLCVGCWVAASLAMFEKLRELGVLPPIEGLEQSTAAAEPVNPPAEPAAEQLLASPAPPAEPAPAATMCQRCNVLVETGVAACPWAGARGCVIPAPVLT
jgi:hypothetical protein